MKCNPNKKRYQNGITLIALVITIIVMLILVMVTINISTTGGIFDQAKEASNRTTKETEKEQLIATVMGTLDNGGINKNLPEGWTYEYGKVITKKR